MYVTIKVKGKGNWNEKVFFQLLAGYGSFLAIYFFFTTVF